MKEDAELDRGHRDLHFRYSREERLALTDRPKPHPPGGLFRRNRSLAIILLDVLLVLLVFILFQFVFTPGRSAVRVGDYNVRLSGFRFQNEIYLTVEFSRSRDRETIPAGAAVLVAVRFPGGERVLDVLPVVEGGSTEVTAVVENANQEVAVEVEILGETVTLRVEPGR